MRIVRQTFADGSTSGLLKMHDDGSTRPLPEDDPSCLAWLAAGGEVEILPYAAPSLESLKDAAVTRLQAEKWARLLGTFRDSKGHLYALDNDSRSLMTGKVAMLGATGIPLPADFVWKTAETDGNGQPVYVPHTAETLLALAVEIETWTNAVFTASETAQTAVRGAGDAAGVAAAEAAVVWPAEVSA